MANTNVRKSIQNKIESLGKEIETLQAELKRWEKIAADYETNSESIDLILSIQLPEKPEPKTKKVKL
jgi:predicted RNase H-like nuclease (RuvC/YqgF family)